MLLNNDFNQPKILNEVFSMDSFTPAQLKNLAYRVASDIENNSDILENEDFDTYVYPLNLPQSVLDMIKAENNIENIEDLSMLDILGSKYSEKYLIKRIINEFKDEYYYLESLGNPLTLYRFIDLYYEGKQKNVKYEGEVMLNHILSQPNIHLGNCWTPFFHKAKEFGDDNHYLPEGVIFEIECQRDTINLANTLVKRNTYTYYNYENEIELIKSAPVMLKRIYKLDNDGDWRAKIINKKYKA